MKFIRQFESWKQNNKLEFLIEAVVNIDTNIVELLKSFEKHPNPNFVSISKTLLDSITSGQDYPKNKYDLVTKSTKEPTKFDVKMGKQTNALNVAKVIRTLLVSVGIEVGKGDIKDDTVQKFSDELIGKLKSTGESITGEFKLVSGDKILWCYDRVNTIEKKGSELFKSCMAGSSKNDLMEIYKSNPDKINLLVKMVDGKVDARVLVWKLDYSSDGNKWYMDRAYCNDNTDKELLFQWLKKEKGEGVSRPEVISGPAWDAKLPSLDIVKLDKVLMKYYPYVDTMSYLTIKKGDSGLEDVGVLSSQEIKADNKEAIDALGDGYSWLSDENARGNFRCRDTAGKRRGISEDDIKLENQSKKLKVVGYKVSLLKNEPLAEFKNITRLIEKISAANDPTVIFEIEPTDDITGLVSYAEMYFEEKDCVTNLLGEKMPYAMAIKVVKIQDLYDQNILLPTKVKDQSIPLQKLYSMMDLHGSFTGINDIYNENAGFGKMLTELDCYILGIQDRIDVTPGNFNKTWGYTDPFYSARANNVTDMLRRLFGDSEYIKLREKLKDGQKLLTLKEWLGIKKKL